MDKIKLLYLIPNFKTAGSQNVLLSLFKGIDKTLFDPYICVEKYPEFIPDDIPKNRCFVYKSTSSKLRDVINFRKLLKKQDIKIVHSWDYRSDYLDSMASRISGVKYLYTKKNNAWSWRWKVKSLFSSHIAYDNPAMKRRFFNSIIFRSKITFIPHGVSTEVFKPSEKIQDEGFNIVCIGNITRNKNQLFIIKAIKELPENVVLHLYGRADEAYLDEIDRFLIEHNLKNRIYFHGYVDNHIIPDILERMDLFVLASNQEGMPVSILEAMACGVLVLSSDSGGGTRFLLDEKYIFSFDDTKDLVEKIKTFIAMDRTERNALEEKGIQEIYLKHTIEKEIMAYESLYKNLLNK